MLLNRMRNFFNIEKNSWFKRKLSCSGFALFFFCLWGKEARVGRAITYSTSISTPLHLHKALLPPVSPPGVLCHPSLLPLLLSVPHYQHRVIGLLRTFIAAGVWVDPTVVILKPLGNNEGNSHGALSEDCLSHLFLISMREILTPKGDLKFYIFLGECALTLLLAHGVGILPLNTPDLLEVFKCLRWVSSLMADSA